MSNDPQRTDTTSLEGRVQHLDERVNQLSNDFNELKGELKPVIDFFRENGNSLKHRISDLEDKDQERKLERRNRVNGIVGQVIMSLMTAMATLLGAWIMMGG